MGLNWRYKMDKQIKKIIVRKGIYNDYDFVKKYKKCIQENQGKSLHEFVKILNNNGISKVILDVPNNVDIMESKLYSAYKQILETGNDNELFEICYQLRNDVAIKITEHVRIYRLIEELEGKNINILPWYHKDINLYISDSWWETDEEILNDFSTISFLDFFIKYKAFGWYNKSQNKE